MMHSTLVQFTPTFDLISGARTAPLGDFARVDDGTIDPPILHLASETAAPEGATVLMSSDSAWTWGQFAAAFPALAAHVIPQEWAGEPTGVDATVDLFPLLAPPTPEP